MWAVAPQSQISFRNLENSSIAIMPENTFLEVGKRAIESIVACNLDATFFVSSDQDGPRDIEEHYPDIINQFPHFVLSTARESRCHYSWTLDEYENVPVEYEWRYTGIVQWNLTSVYSAEIDRQHFVKKKRPRFTAEQKQMWQNSCAIQYADIGGFLALDMTAGEDYPVVFLNPNRGAISNCAILGETLEEFLHHWSRLAFVEISEKCLSAFTDDFTKPLNCEHPYAKKWLKWLTTGEAPSD